MVSEFEPWKALRRAPEIISASPVLIYTSLRVPPRSSAHLEFLFCTPEFRPRFALAFHSHSHSIATHGFMVSCPDVRPHVLPDPMPKTKSKIRIE